jgi:TubC N-terminal docking domain
MSVAQILSKAQTMGVRLRLDGDRVKIAGPASAVATIKPEIAAHKPEIVAHLCAAANDAADCTGALRSRDGGLYLPWGPCLA